jgi:hypothetical protein
MAGKGKRNLNAADLRAMNRSGLVTRRYPAGGGRAEVRIGMQKPPKTSRTHEADRGNVLHAPPRPPSPRKPPTACEERHGAGRTYPDAEVPRGGGP